MAEIDPFVFRFSIFVLAIFVGYFVVWAVTPALHTPLMSVTNAISSVIVVGALIAVSVNVGPGPIPHLDTSLDKLMGSQIETVIVTSSWSAWTSKGLGFVALILASINIFGGFLVTSRMLAMYKKKEKK
jgi:NAD(P) transhydrogenase subunit alpha